MSKILSQNKHSIMVDNLPPDIEGTDVVFVSLSGKRRGLPSARRVAIEGISILALGVFVCWPFVEIAMRAGLGWTVFGFFTMVGWGMLMGYVLGRTFNNFRR